jgi:hypothetical protein
MSRPGFLGLRAALLAVVVHAGVLALLLVPKGRAAIENAPPSQSLSDEDVEIAIVRENEPISERGPTIAEMAAPIAHPMRASSAAPATSDSRNEPPPNDVEPAPPMPAPATTFALGPSTPDIGLALGAPNAFAARGALEGVPDRPSSAMNGARPAVPDPAEAKRSVEASLNAPARERERLLGLGPEGPVRAALQDATHASRAPVNGSAVFVAVADGNGNLERLDVVTCSGARAAWEDAAGLARASLTGKKLRVAGASIGNVFKRTVMSVQVTSSSRMPSGHDPGVNASLFRVPLRKGEGKRATNVSILDPIPKTEVMDVEIAPGLFIKLAVVRWDLLDVHGDPVDIGAKPQRVVHTAVTQTTYL